MEELSTFVRPDGRTVAWAEYGDPAGRPLVVLHGTPGSRLQASLLDAPAAAAGVRIISPDRPGYGASTRAVPLDFSVVAADTVALLDHLGVAEADVAGISGGGGYALTIAATRPDRVRRVVLAGGSVPGAPASARRGTMTGNVRVMRWVRFAPAAYRRSMLRNQGRTSPTAVQRLVAVATGLPGRRPPIGSPAADLAVLEDATAVAALSRAAAEARVQGPDAVIDDLRCYLDALPVPLASVAAPVTLLHGADDANVPIGVARWVAGQLPDARLVELPDTGHLFVAVRPELLLEALTA